MSTTSQETSSKISLPRLFVGLRGISSADLPREILAGITLAALMIPLNIGYAQVAGLPPIVGLYAAIVPILAFALFSTSRNLVASPDAPIAALIGSLLVTFTLPEDPYYVQLALALAILCSLIFFIFWVFKLGFLANFLSRAVLIGFISGLGIEVFVNQLEKILGVTVHAEEFFLEVVELIRSIPIANWYSVAIGAGSIIIIRLLRRYAPKLPGALLALVLMTAVVAFFNLDEKGVSVLGEIPSGLPSLALPRVRLIDYIWLFPGALAICGITLAEGLLIARKYAQKYEYKLDADQEMFAFGAANITSGLTGGLVLGSSASRTAAMDSAGTTSQIPSLAAAGAVALVLLFFSDLLALLPNAALGGIVANAVLSLIEVEELRELYRLRRSEFWIAMICLLSVLTLGALQAVVIAFLLSTIDVVGRAAKPRTAVLSESPDGRRFIPFTEMPTTLPGLIVYRFGAPLYFANAHLFQEQVEQLIAVASLPVQWFVLDAEAITDIDTTGAEAFKQALEFCSKRNVTFALARASDLVLELLERYELMVKMGTERLYATNHDAVAAFYQERGEPVQSFE